jgi:hypothetical protein
MTTITMPKVRYNPIPQSSELSEPLRAALNRNFEAVLEETYDTRGFAIQMRDDCQRIATAALERLQRDIDAKTPTVPPMRGKVVTLSDAVELKLNEREQQSDAELGRMFRGALKGGFWDGVRKVVALLLMGIAAWTAAKMHSSLTEHPQSTVAPAVK